MHDSLSHVQFFATPWTVAHQVPLSMGFSRHKYWSGLPFPSPGDLPDPGIESACPSSPVLQADSFTIELPGKSQHLFRQMQKRLLLTCKFQDGFTCTATSPPFRRWNLPDTGEAFPPPGGLTALTHLGVLQFGSISPGPLNVSSQRWLAVGRGGGETRIPGRAVREEPHQCRPMWQLLGSKCFMTINSYSPERL